MFLDVFSFVRYKLHDILILVQESEQNFWGQNEMGALIANYQINQSVLNW